jgi:hypothetical protein
VDWLLGLLTASCSQVTMGEVRNPESYEAYKRTGTFPDLSMLVLEVFDAEEKERSGIRFASKRIALWAAVKDRNRPGGGVPWAYYSFPARR